MESGVSGAVTMDYSKITNEEFDEAVRQIARRMGVDAILDIPGVWECVSEELNNAALDICPSAKEENADESD